MSELRLAANMCSLRTLHEYSQIDVSKCIHISRQTYSLYENGKRMPDIETVCGLAKLYGLSVDALLFEDLSTLQIAEKAANYDSLPRAALESVGADVIQARLSSAELEFLLAYRSLPPEAQANTRQFLHYQQYLNKKKK